MKQDKIKYLGEEEFRRLTGIKPETFEKMLKDTFRYRSKKKQKVDVKIG